METASRPGYDIIVQAMSGLMSVTGERDGEPTKAGVALLDVITGLYAAVGVLAALRERDVTGHGRHVSVALFDASVAAMVNQAANYLIGDVVPERMGTAHPNIVPYQSFHANDRPFILAAGNDRLFARTCEVAGHASWADDPRFVTNEARVVHRDELVPLLAGAFRAARHAGDGSRCWTRPGSRVRRSWPWTRCSRHPTAPAWWNRSTIPCGGCCAWSPTRSGSTAWRRRRGRRHRCLGEQTRQVRRELDGPRADAVTALVTGGAEQLAGGVSRRRSWRTRRSLRGDSATRAVSGGEAQAARRSRRPRRSTTRRALGGAPGGGTVPRRRRRRRRDVAPARIGTASRIDRRRSISSPTCSRASCQRRGGWGSRRAP